MPRRRRRRHRRALIDDEWIYGSSSPQIVATLIQGRPNGMPSFRNKLTEDADVADRRLGADDGRASPQGRAAPAARRYREHEADHARRSALLNDSNGDAGVAMSAIQSAAHPAGDQAADRSTCSICSSA
jgi:hypothetical protein